MRPRARVRFGPPCSPSAAAYRVIQEALTNSLKHGGGSATVTVEHAEHELRIAVADTGGGPGATVQGSGHGLVGMRERVRVFGG